MHAIHVLHSTAFNQEKREVLAIEISELKTAKNIVRNIARSYDEHGTDRSEMTYWFKDSGGLHYLWTESETIPIKARKENSSSLSRRLSDLLSLGNTFDLPKPRYLMPLRRAA